MPAWAVASQFHANGLVAGDSDRIEQFVRTYPAAVGQVRSSPSLYRTQWGLPGVSCQAIL
jgi:hypothetical protein